MGSTKLTDYNKISNARPDLIKYLKDKNDAEKYSYGSTKVLNVICPNCGFEKRMQPNTLCFQGFGCPVCDDKISFPNKFMMNVLIQLKLEFTPEKIFEWSDNKRYDFYIPSLDMIIEMHGEQHYKEWNLGKTLKEEKQNDKIKKNIAILNDIKNYIIINCSDTRFESIKNSTIYELGEYFNFDNIKWELIADNCTKSYVIKVVDLIKENYSVLDIANILNISSSTVYRLLKIADDSNILKYDRFYSSKHAVLKIDIKTQKVIEEYSSITNASKTNICSFYKISDACKGKHNHVYMNFIWKFKDEKSIKILENKYKNTKRVLKCVNQYNLHGDFIKKWNSISEICEENYNYNKENITRNCNGYNKTAYGYIWKYC